MDYVYSNNTFAVDREGAPRRLADVEKALQDSVARGAAVHEEQFVVVEASVGESPVVVQLLVESNDVRHVALPKVREICFRRVERITCADGRQ